ncbi:MAG: glutamate 5-kinase [Lentisphaerae bacterium]|nr:glutamate 5-kinase [Lentisphaerota bacterium]
MDVNLEDKGCRQRALTGVRRVVVKVGTRLLTDMAGLSASQRIDQLVGGLAVLRERGWEVLLVSSGAIGAGMTVLGTARRPRAVPQLQAHAAVGQCRLMYHYETACVARGFHCAQLLLTADDVQNRERHLNVTSCLDALLGQHVLPIINENDSVSVAEIRLGDNDTLAAMVATMLRADLTILLTTVDGMHRRLPDGTLGERLSVVHHIDDELRQMAGGTDGNRFSVGGMATKLRAAEVVMRAGESLIIADGRDFGVLAQIAAGADIGTLFCGRGDTRRMPSHKRFLAFFSEPAGEVVVDAGAEEAVCRKGRSLLPGGVTDQAGAFGRGDTVRIVNAQGLELGRGISNYRCDEVARIKGRKSADIRRILGVDACFDEVIHRDYLVLTR